MKLGHPVPEWIASMLAASTDPFDVWFKERLLEVHGHALVRVPKRVAAKLIFAYPDGHDHMKALELPLTVLRPMAFMELMTHKKFFPAASTWHVMPKLMGSSRNVGWLCSDDLGAIAAKAFAAPHRFVGNDLALASDVQSLDDFRSIYREVIGRNPRRLPMPVWLFERFGFVGKDLTTMWRWLRTGHVDLDTLPTSAIHPDALTVGGWLSKQKAAE